MKRKLLFKTASLLFKYAFPVYKILYYRFKNKQDAFEIKLMKKIIKEGDSVLDIGANIGFYSEIMSMLVGENGKVYCFEPDNLNFKYLSHNTKNNKNVSLIRKAVAEDDGEIMLYTSDTINVENTTYKPEHFDSIYKVEKTSIDKFVQQKFAVSFIKMDIQGAELKALEGMKKTLMENKNICLLTEIHPYCLLNCGTKPDEIVKFIESNDFKIFLFDKNALKEFKNNDVINFRTEEEYFYNILCVRNSSEIMDSLNQFLN